ncbi:MAG: right-handed parallel beta-helix repeat-containing protein [Oscillospiraceae bacterium]|nr:right-handed parallel beta-helix repeat-containing protein [Oscillospiraceae bacterium]
MKAKTSCRFLSAALALVLLLTLLGAAFPTASADTIVYTLDPGELENFSKGAKADGETVRAGTDGYFTVFFSATAQVQGNGKDFTDGYSSTKRIHYSAPSEFGDTVKNAIRIKTSGAATVKVWWGCGDVGRQVAIFDENGTVLTQTEEKLGKNALCISELSIAAAGTYFIGNVVGNNYHYKIEVTETEAAPAVPRKEWSKVAAPVISKVKDNGDGTLSVTVDAVVGAAGGDEVVVTMYAADAKPIASRSSVLEKDEHIITFEPEYSGEYIFEAVLKRYAEENKPAKKTKTADFLYPLASPILISATSAGNGKVTVVWEGVKEAESYRILCDGKEAGTSTATQFTVEGLTVGQKYSFTVEAIRGKEAVSSAAIAATAFADAKQAWGFTYYGPSINAESNGYVGDVNEDGKVTVYSENGRGKVVPASVDGVAFYYTAVPTEYNFTLRAKVTVDSWAYSNGQEGFGLMVTDRLGPAGDSANFWNNQFMAAATKIEYMYDSATETAYDLNGTGTKYSMKLGLGVIAKTGVTKENLPLLEANDTAAVNEQFVSQIHTLETAAGYWGKEKGTYNIVGNYTNEVTGSIESKLLTSFDLEIQKNNTGYFITYYGENGEIVTQRKYYGADSLSMLDADYVYAGFFAARNARITVSDVRFTSILASEDAPAEEKPVIKLEPSVLISSPTVTTKLTYPLTLDANVSGTVTVSVEREAVLENVSITGGERYHADIPLKEYGENHIHVEFIPDPEQELGEDTVLASTNKQFADAYVTCNKGFYHRKTIYVAPEGLPNGAGTKEHPLDIYTAVNNAVAGQCIVLMEGTYSLKDTVRIQRGMDGTADAPIRMIADPEAASRPVLDFKGECAGIVHGGDYWYFYGFDVTNSQDGQKGFQVSGNYNTLDQINAYDNGNTGIQISRYSGTDLFPDWPAHNRILNCTSYNNADPGYEDADGFACKLTAGEGNVFDGCVAYNNADDGWDMYAKVETGSIGAVTVRNCIAYQNGYVLENGALVEAGNGNGFKLGGESLSGKHILENSYAFGNKSKGIDSNSCPDIIVKNCTAYNNGTYNVALYTNNAANTDFSASGILSWKDSTAVITDSLAQGENLKPKGSQNTAAYQNDTTYYWNGEQSVNASGARLTADMFVSLEFKGVLRNADGTPDLQGFLEKAATAPADAGAVPGGTASAVNTALEADLEHTYNESWYTKDLMFHWHECECGDRGDFGKHTLEWIIDKEATEDESGKKHQQCSVCGYQGPVLDLYYGEIVPGVNDGNPVATAAIIAAAVAALGGAGFFLLRKKKQ